MAAKDSVKEALLALGLRFTLFFFPTDLRCFCVHRPAPEEAAQWRESLDRVLNNSCRSTLYYTHSYSSSNTLICTCERADMDPFVLNTLYLTRINTPLILQVNQKAQPEHFVLLFVAGSFVVACLV